MIIRTETVVQTIDGTEQVTLEKQLVMVPEPCLGMVRKRRPGPEPTQGAVLLVHGFGQNRYAFHGSQRSFSAYLAAQGWDVFNVDLRGHGRSRKWSGLRASGVDEYIDEDLPAFAEEASELSGHRELFLVGFSMGGLLSCAVASTHLRERMRGLVMVASPFEFGLGSLQTAIVRILMQQLGRLRWPHRRHAVPVWAIGAQVRRLRAVVDHPASLIPLRPWAPRQVEPLILDEYIARSFDRGSLHAMIDIALGRRVGREELGESFRRLQCPMLFIGGTLDRLAPAKAVEAAFHTSRAPDKTYRAFPLGHIDLLAGQQAPSTTWPLIADWLEVR